MIPKLRTNTLKHRPYDRDGLQDPDGGAMRNYINLLPEPDRSLFIHELRAYAVLGVR